MSSTPMMFRNDDNYGLAVLIKNKQEPLPATVNVAIIAAGEI